MFKTRHALSALGLLLASAWGLQFMDDANAHAAPGLNGQWGGQQIRMHVDAKGATIELGCGQGHIAKAIQLDRHQRFVTKGHYEEYGAGPQQADATPGMAATYSGHLVGDILTLEIRPSSGDAQRYTLTRGKNVKLIRCY